MSPALRPQSMRQSCWDRTSRHLRAWRLRVSCLMRREIEPVEAIGLSDLQHLWGGCGHSRNPLLSPHNGGRFNNQILVIPRHETSKIMATLLLFIAGLAASIPSALDSCSMTIWQYRKADSMRAGLRHPDTSAFGGNLPRRRPVRSELDSPKPIRNTLIDSIDHATAELFHDFPAGA